MAIEREVARHYITNHLSTECCTINKCRSLISSLLMPTYMVDFGVITYELSYYTVLIENYTNSKLEFRVQYDFKRLGKGLAVKHESGLIPPRATRAIDIIFNTTKKDYPNLVCIYGYFYIQIINGPKIPIKIRAEISPPNLEFSRSIVNFGRVRCGDCQRKSIIIHNK